MNEKGGGKKSFILILQQFIKKSIQKIYYGKKKLRNCRKKLLNHEILYDDLVFNLQIVKILLGVVEISLVLGVEISLDSFSCSIKIMEKVFKKKSNDLLEYLKDVGVNIFVFV